MDPCARCGHALGVGRYCVNCGHPREAGPDDWRTGTAERPAVPADPGEPGDSGTPADPGGPGTPPGPAVATPPPVYAHPPQARYPLYADEGATPVTSVSPAAALTWDTRAPGAPGDEPGPAAGGDGRRPVLPWVLGAAVLLLFVGLGAFLLLGGPGDQAPDRADDPAPASGSDDAGASTDTGGQTPSDPGPTDPATPTTSPDPFTGDPQDVAAAATAVAPSTAPPGLDVDNDPVRYDAFLMLDGRDDTTWRTPGDASGSTLRFTLREPTRLDSVGLLNGYAKVDPGYDGYTANRRVTAVEWVFDDGTVVPQTLGESRAVQSIDVDVVSRTVRLRIVSVSRPGPGRKGRDYTAISTVELVGVPRQ